MKAVLYSYLMKLRDVLRSRKMLSHPPPPWELRVYPYRDLAVLRNMVCGLSMFIAVKGGTLIVEVEGPDLAALDLLTEGFFDD